MMHNEDKLNIICDTLCMTFVDLKREIHFLKQSSHCCEMTFITTVEKK